MRSLKNAEILEDEGIEEIIFRELKQFRKELETNRAVIELTQQIVNTLRKDVEQIQIELEEMKVSKGSKSQIFRKTKVVRQE